MSARPMRILMVSHTWLGANDDSYARAFRRAGHSVSVVSDEGFLAPNLRHRALRAAKRIAAPLLVADYQRALLAEAEALRPHLFFVFKGTHVKAETIVAIQAMGAVAINYYPDVGLGSESRHIARAAAAFDWVFTSKSFRLEDLRRAFGVKGASFLPHAYDPEVHKPVELDAEDVDRYACDVGFVGTWSPKKERLLAALRLAAPSLSVKIWGNGWERAQTQFSGALMRRPVNGLEYAKAICASRICIALLVEAPRDAQSGDLTTARTFEIPAIGAFMLHERTEEAASYFPEGEACAMFGDPDELIEKVRYYLSHPRERDAIAAAGHRRALSHGHSYDDRAQVVIEKAQALRASRFART